MSWGAETVSMMKSKELACFFMRRRLGDDDFVGAEPFGVGDFRFGSGELDDVRAEGVGEFESHVAEAAEADDADFFVGADLPVAQR